MPEYTVDAAQGPVTGSTRVLGLAGAFVAIAEGNDGIARNPASVAVRLPYSWHRFDYTFGVDFAIGAWLPRSDFFNRGSGQQQAQVEKRSLLFGSVAGALQYEHAGIGAAAEGQNQALRRPGDSQAGLAPIDLTGNFGILHGSIAYGFFDGQLAVGAGPRVTGISVSARSSASDLLSVGGIGYQGGFVYKPIGQQFRFGAAFKSAVVPSLAPSGQDANLPYRTRALRLPWQASVGILYRFGSRPLNPPLITVEQLTHAAEAEQERVAAQRRSELQAARAAYQLEPTTERARRVEQLEASIRSTAAADEHPKEALVAQTERALLQAYLARPRRQLLVSTELLILGPSADSIGFGSYLQGSTSLARLELSGETVTLSPRLGVETEAIPNWLRLRAGTYLEPARVTGATDRIHGTFGFDVKTFSWDAFGLIGDFDSWQLSAAVDGARKYLNTSFSVGFWH